jgi:dynein heavy chain, axonemal
LTAWLKTRTNREKTVFSELFEQSFIQVYTWGTQNCEFMMEVLQCNIIQQMLAILDGLVPYSKDVEQADMKSVAGSNEGETFRIFFSFREKSIEFMYFLLLLNWRCIS